MKTCDAVQERLAEVGAAAVQEDKETATHLESCEDCTAFMAHLMDLDAALDDLPEQDASDALVASTLQAVRRAQSGGAGGPSINRRWVAGAMAASLVIAATIGMSQELFRDSSKEGRVAGTFDASPSIFDQIAEFSIFGHKREQVVVNQEAPTSSVDRGYDQTAQLERSIDESDGRVSGQLEAEGRQRESAEADREVFRGGGETSQSAAAPLPESEVALADTKANTPQSSTTGASSLQGDLARQGDRTELQDLNYGEANLPDEPEPSLFATADPDSREGSSLRGDAAEQGKGNAQGALSNLRTESESEAAKDFADDRLRAIEKADEGLDPAERLAIGETFHKQPSDKPQGQRDADQLLDRESELVARLYSQEHGAQVSLDALQSDKKFENKQIVGGVAGAPAAAAPKVGAKSKEAGAYRFGNDDQVAGNEILAQRRNSDTSDGVVATAPPQPQRKPPVSVEADSFSFEETAPAVEPEKEAKDRKKNILKNVLVDRPQDMDESVVGDRAEEEKRAEEIRRYRVSEDIAPVNPESMSLQKYYDRYFPGKQAPEDGIYAQGETRSPNQRAQVFLTRYSALEGLAFQDPRGYWSNSYIPGDPAMRLLEARLRDWNRAALGTQGQLEQSVQPIVQPFDAPESAALALYLQADAAAIEGPTRMRLQIGLKGAEREGGHRPAMNIGLVVDLRTLAKDGMGPRLAALIMALEQARQPGDRFSLIAAGPGGGMIVQPENFRYGALRVAVEQLFEKRDERLGEAVSLPLAVSLAADTVRRTDDPSAILGSSLVLLATGNSLADELPDLEGMVHADAVGGIPLSVVSVGGSTSPADIDRLVAAGQGNRRVLDKADEAEALIDRELHSASRAVARAVRLRVRLAPGVKLIDVLGSQKLEAPQAERVREAEQSLDRRLAQNLGIIADRGLDEEGIQIVIPSFYAGDSHVVLLDVIAENPGPVADVRVRYKDVVYLKNGVSEASLTLNRGTTAQGPLERNVLKNLVAWEMVRELRAISGDLAAGNSPLASLKMAGLRDLLAGLRHEVPGWANDPDLVADQTMLNNYLAVLMSPQATDTAVRDRLADSLQVAAFRKLQPRAE